MKINDIILEDNHNRGEFVYNKFKELSNILQNEGYDEIYEKYYKNTSRFFLHRNSESILTYPSFYQNEQTNPLGYFYKSNNKEVRKPTDTPDTLHNYFDLELEKKFGIKYRSNSLFAYKVELGMNGSKKYVVFPKNGFKILYSENIHDLTTTIYTHYNFITGKVFNTMIEGKIEKMFNVDFEPKDDSEFYKYIKIFLNKLISINKNFSLKDKSKTIKYFYLKFMNEFEKLIKADYDVDLIQHINKQFFLNIFETIYDRLMEEFEKIIDSYSEKDIDMKSFHDSEFMIYAEDFIMVNTDFIDYLTKMFFMEKWGPKAVISKLYGK